MANEPEQPKREDAVIATAFRRSLLIMGVLGVLGLLLKWLASPPPAEEPITLREAARPVTATPVTARVPPSLAFRDVTAAARIAFTHESGAYGERLLPETMGGGVAFLDYDGDLDPDLLFVNSGHWPWRAGAEARPAVALYRNAGDGRFEDVTQAAGLDMSLYGMGVATGDYDGDGRVDVFVTAVGENRLLRNVSGKRFEDVTAAAGVAGGAETWSTSAAFFDFDRDGDLDLFVANYVQWSREIDFEVDYRLTGIGRAYGPPTNYQGAQSYLYENDGDGGFTDVSDKVAVVNPATGAPAGKALGVVPVDYDQDGWMDLVVANDTVGNFLFRNQGDGSFREQGIAAGVAFDTAGAATGAMGIDAAWLDGGQRLAIAIGNFANEMTSFFVADGAGALFTDEAIITGIGPASRKVLSFGLYFFDADLDGREDLLQVNGHVENEISVVQPSQSYAQPPQLFWQCGAECPRRFAGLEVGGDFGQPLVGRGASFADIDGDGDLDVVVTQVGGPPKLLRNEQETGHHWLRLAIEDPQATTIGTVATVEAGGKRQVKTLVTARSYLSQTEAILTFGLGEATKVDTLTLRWPDGVGETIAVPQVDTLQRIRRRR